MPKANVFLSGQDHAKIIHWAKIGLSVTEICSRLPGLTAERCRGIANRANFFFPTQRTARRPAAASVTVAEESPESMTPDDISNESLAHLQEGVGPKPQPVKERLNVLETPRPNSLATANDRIVRLERTIEKLKAEIKRLEGIVVSQAGQIHDDRLN